MTPLAATMTEPQEVGFRFLKVVGATRELAEGSQCNIRMTHANRAASITRPSIVIALPPAKRRQFV